MTSSWADHIASGAELERLLEPSQQASKRTVARFKSDNDRQAYAFEVNTQGQRRIKTGPETLLSREITTPIVFAQRLFKRHVDGLKQENLQTSRMMLRNFEWLYPGPDATAHDLEIFDRLSSNAMLVTNDEIREIMNIELSSVTSPPTEPGHHFYFRAWALTGEQLQSLLDYVVAHELRFVESDRWQKLLQLYPPGRQGSPSTYTIRYVGTVEGPKRPIDRFYEDIKRSSGILPEFMRALEEALPDVADSAEVYRLPDAYLAQDSYLNPDDVERMLIQLFHHPTLLNRQRGGYYASYVPSSDDADVFRDMKTNFWYSFRAGASFPDDHLQAVIAGHFREIQQYVNSNPEETGSGRHLFTDELRAVNERQGRPMLYQGQTVMVFVGKDQTYEEYLMPKSYIEGGSRAGHLTRDFLFRLVKWEAQANKRAFYPDAFDPTSGPFCFVDLWPWLRHKNIVHAAQYLQWYFGFVRPIVAVTFSRIVNNITLADFRHGNGVRMNTFTSIVGTPTIQYYDHDDETGEPDVATAFINIPHIHHGHDKYGKQVRQLRRFIDLTNQYTFLIGDVTLKVLDDYEFEDLPEDDRPSRRQLCEEILARVESLCSVYGPHKRLYDSLQQARADLLEYFKSEALEYSYLEEQPVLNADGRLKMFSLGKAIGGPESTERKAQLDSLWGQDLPDLHVSIPHDEDRRAEWAAEMQKVPEGHYYYLHLLAQQQPSPTTANILAKFRPPSARSDNWMLDEQTRHQAAVAAGLFIDEHRGTDAPPELIGERGPDKFLQPRNCQGRRAKIPANGKFSVRWINGDNNEITSRFVSKIAVPQSSTERYLYFTSAGIDVVGPNQQSFRPTLFGGISADATIPIKSFANDPSKKELWLTVCGAHEISTQGLEVMDFGADAVDYGRVKGVQPLVTNASEEKPLQNRPPKRLDGNWLLDQFLLSKDHLVDGGNFRTADVEKFPDSTEDSQAFVQFLKQPEYINHPFTPWWLKFLDVATPQNVVLAKNLPILRNSVCVNQQERSKNLRVQTKRGSKDSSKGVQVHERYYILGPQGSAVPHPFDMSLNQSCVSDEARKKAKKASQATGAGSGGNVEDDGALGSSKTTRKASKFTETGLKTPFGSLVPQKGRKGRTEEASGSASQLATESAYGASSGATQAAKRKRKESETEAEEPGKRKRKESEAETEKPETEADVEEHLSRRPRRRNVRTGKAEWGLGEQ